MTQKKALITGITGQIGSYLAEELLANNFQVIGLVRRSSRQPHNLARVRHLLDQITIAEGDLTDQGSLDRAMEQVHPDYVFNLAAQSFVALSWSQPTLTMDVTGLGVLRVLEAVYKYAPQARMVTCSSSEMFGKVQETPQTETTPFYPRSPYGIAKLAGFWLAKNYRESHGLFASTAICFNAEGPRRGEEFVTRKISLGAARIALGMASELRLGNLKARRDWGHAKDTARAIRLIAEHDLPDDFVVATGETHSIEEFLEIAFGVAGLDWHQYVRQDEQFIRPAEVDLLLGNPAKIRKSSQKP